jgi:esterase/lipase
MYSPLSNDVIQGEEAEMSAVLLHGMMGNRKNWRRLGQQFVLLSMLGLFTTMIGFAICPKHIQVFLLTIVVTENPL